MSSTGGRTKKPLQVEVGQRYILKLPRGLDHRHQLYGLRRTLNDWLSPSLRPGHPDEDDHWVADPEAEPLWVNGYDVVTVRDTAIIEPVSDEGPDLDEYGVPRLDVNGNGLMRYARWDPLPDPQPAAVIHLSRRPNDVEVAVLLTEGQITDLNLGLDPRDRYAVHGHLLEIHSDEDIETPYMIEEQDFTIPVTWLRSPDSVRAWRTKAEQQHDRELLTLLALPEVEQEWLRAEAEVQSCEEHLQTRIDVQEQTEAWVRDRVPPEERPGWQKLLEDRQHDYDMAKEWAAKARREADRLRKLIEEGVESHDR